MRKIVLVYDESISQTLALIPAKGRVADLLGRKDNRNIVYLFEDGRHTFVLEEDHLMLSDGILTLDSQQRFALSDYKPTEADRKAYNEWRKTVRRWKPPLIKCAESATVRLSVNYEEARVYNTNATNAQFKAGNLLFYEPANIELIADGFSRPNCYVSKEGTIWQRNYTFRIAYQPWLPVEDKQRKTFLRKRRNWSF